GIEQRIFSFEPVSAPINLVLLLDLSGSTRDRRNVMIETARSFIDSLGPADRIAVAAFTRDFVVVSDFTSDKKLLKKAVERMKKIEGGTAFYDAMWATFDLLQRVKGSRKAIVVLTDGLDNSLSERGYARTNHTFDEVLSRAAEEDATIYPIYLNPEEKRLLSILDDPWVSAMRRERVERRLNPSLTAHRQLEALAEESAGRVFVAEDERELDGVYQRVAGELRLVYSLSYEPQNTGHDGKFRKITVSVNHEGAVVKTRRGYIAK
ncbi:MAG TPA: VWA domain-containing protein, partial [Blastocatellia bacterium]|nr:VWA domain-containing protein [Blastocatellia bacterium]